MTAPVTPLDEVLLALKHRVDARSFGILWRARDELVAIRAALIASAPPPEARVEVLEVVDFYEREFYPLSNFSSFRIRWAGRWFDTSEHAYHWEKFPDCTELRKELRLTLSAHEAFKLAERNKHLRRPDWDDVKVEVMRRIIRAKAEQHEYVRRKLMETGDRPLIEGSWRDNFWGIGPNKDGQNMLGKLWMELRAALASDHTDSPPVRHDDLTPEEQAHLEAGGALVTDKHGTRMSKGEGEG